LFQSMILVIIRTDVTNKIINDDFSRTVEATLWRVVLGPAVVVDTDKNYSMLMCNEFYLFVRYGDKCSILK
jgi:hypothetical protein